MCSDADGHKTIGRSNIAGTLLDVYHKRVDVHDYIIDTENMKMKRMKCDLHVRYQALTFELVKPCSSPAAVISSACRWTSAWYASRASSISRSRFPMASRSARVRSPAARRRRSSASSAPSCSCHFRISRKYSKTLTALEKTLRCMATWLVSDAWLHDIIQYYIILCAMYMYVQINARIYPDQAGVRTLYKALTAARIGCT
eukprot:COSAG05_NODE_4771_length_1379_cov_1.183594_1_plen_201_part_00